VTRSSAAATNALAGIAAEQEQMTPPGRPVVLIDDGKENGGSSSAERAHGKRPLEEDANTPTQHDEKRRTPLRSITIDPNAAGRV